jgi:hypothetical protein
MTALHDGQRESLFADLGNPVNEFVT